jgi:drug/metabolite transporter (DMT)-like permease
MSDEPVDAVDVTERHPGLAPNVRGALWMLAATLSFTAMTTLIKFLGDDYPAALQTFYRQAAGFAIMLPLILKHGRKAYATTRPWLLLFRASLGTIAMILSFYAYQKLPLADANALSFTRTLWLVVLAALVVREKIGPLRIAATVVGFLGVLVMVRPGVGGGFVMGLPAAAMLASSLLFAMTIIGMKVMTRDHRPLVLLVWSASLGLIFSLPGAFLSWRWPTPADFALLCLMGVIGICNQGFYIKAMESGDAAAMAPMEYIRLVFTAGAGFLLFNEVPSVWTIAGALVVVVSTLIITLREMQLARRARALNRG